MRFIQIEAFFSSFSIFLESKFFNSISSKYPGLAWVFKIYPALWIFLVTAIIL